MGRRHDMKRSKTCNDASFKKQDDEFKKLMSTALAQTEACAHKKKTEMMLIMHACY